MIYTEQHTPVECCNMLAVLDEWYDNGRPDLLMESLCIQTAFSKMHLHILCLPIPWPPATIGHMFTKLTLANSSRYSIHASSICPAQWFIHEENTSPKCQTPPKVSICPLSDSNTLLSDQDRGEDYQQTDFPEVFSSSLKSLVLQPAVASAGQVAVSDSRWRMWRSWPGKATNDPFLQMICSCEVGSKTLGKYIEQILQ